MITNPTRQRALRGRQATRTPPRAANTAEHRAALAARLTLRDRWIIRMLHEHRVLTSSQITALAFPSSRSARQRLRELYCWSVLDRFQPLITLGTAPMHYVLAPVGAAVLAAEDGLSIKDLGYQHERAIGIAHSLRLAHTIGVNDWFTALVHRARHDNSMTLAAWWSETRCARHFGDLTKPDAYGRWTAHGHEIEFFLEYDLGTEALDKLAGKLHGYATLAAATGVTTPLLIWLPTAFREATARRLLAPPLAPPRPAPLSASGHRRGEPPQPPHPAPQPRRPRLAAPGMPRRHRRPTRPARPARSLAPPAAPHPTRRAGQHPGPGPPASARPDAPHHPTPAPHPTPRGCPPRVSAPWAPHSRSPRSGCSCSSPC